MTRVRYAVRIGRSAQLVGTLDFEARGSRQHSTFAYDQSWIDHPQGFPIAPRMSFAQRRFFTAKGPGPHD